MINGGVKFFEQSFALFKNGATATASSNAEGAKFMLDTNRFTQWESIGSNDATTETITITLPTSKQIDRILLTDFNFKKFEVKYDSGGGFVDFTNVTGVNGVTNTKIAETDYAYDSAYYEFDAVTTNEIQITVDTTQVANAQKYLHGFIATLEIGTFQGYPRVKPSSNRNETKAKTLSRKYVIQKTYETNSISMIFKTHPYQADIDIVDTLFDMEETFLVYPCGGRVGEKYFKLAQKNWRLKDVYNMQIMGKLRNEWEKGVYLLGANKILKFEEHI